MAYNADNAIKIWRNEAKMTAVKLADAVGCDVTTIYRYEQGKLKPSPDVMYQICKAVGNLCYWCTWMSQEFPGSYAIVHPRVPNLDMSGTILSLYAGIMDAELLRLEVFRTFAEGKHPEKEICNKLKATLVKLSGFSQALLNKLSV